MAKCLERLGDSFNVVKMDARAVKPVPVSKLINTDMGVITPTTQFAKGRIMPLGKRYKKWTKANNIEWVSKGNNPVMYEREFLNTLKPTDFAGIQELKAVDKVAAAAPKPVVAPKPVGQPVAQALPTEVNEMLWKDKAFKEVFELPGGVQRDVFLIEDANGVRFVEKVARTGGKHAEEMLYYNMSEDLGMNIVPKTAQWKRQITKGVRTFDEQGLQVMVQEFIDAPVSRMQMKTGFAGEASHEAKALKKFLLETKQGRDWNLMDYMMGQIDRNGGNFTYKLQKGVISDIKLIDNNGALFGADMKPWLKRVPGSEYGDVTKLMSLDPQTKTKLKQFVQRLSSTDGGPRSWDTFKVNLTEMFEKQGISGHAADKAARLGDRLKFIVDNDYKVPLADAVERRVILGGKITNADIVAGDEILFVKPKVVPKPKPKPKAIEAPAVDPAATPLQTDLVAKEWAGVKVEEGKILTGGAQREVKLVQEKGGQGRKFVEKFGDAKGNNIDLMYYNIAEELEMKVVPKITQLKAPVGASKNSRIRQEFVDMKTGFANEDLITARVDVNMGQLREYVIATKDGRDWNFLDYLFAQGDRHAGNFVYKVEKGKIKALRLIDNNTALNVESGVPHFKTSAPGTTMALPAETKAAYQKWLKSLGYVEGEAASWNNVRHSMDQYFKRHGLDGRVRLPNVSDLKAQGISDKLVGRMKAVVDADYHMPFANNMKSKLYNIDAPFVAGERIKIISDAEILQGAKKIDALAKQKLVPVPEPVAVAPAKPKLPAKPLKQLQTEIQEQEWFKLQTEKPFRLKGGAQREVKLVKEKGGERQFVEKFGDIQGNNVELMYANVAAELEMKIVPKVARFDSLVQGDRVILTGKELKAAENSFIRQEFVDMKMGHAHDQKLLKPQMKEFIINTKEGRDWNFIDYIFDQRDRHGGNYAFSVEKGAIKNIKLIDNNTALSTLRDNSEVFSRKVAGTTMPLPTATKEAYKKWLTDLGWKEGEAASWKNVEAGMKAYMKQHGFPVETKFWVEQRAKMTARMKSVVDADFHVPFTKGSINKLGNPPFGATITDADIAKGTKKIEALAKPKPKAKPKIEAAAEDALPHEKIAIDWKYKEFTDVKKSTIKGGAQREVKLVEDQNGRKFVEKVTPSGGGHPEEMIYYNLNEELGMKIVPKTAQWNRGQLGDVLVQEFVEAPVAFNQAPRAVHLAQEQLQLKKFVLETKEGRDWNLLDYLMGQLDRNRGNFVYNIKKGAVADFKLIDNNTALFKYVKGGPTGGDITQLLSLDAETKVKFQKWITNLGYDGAAESWGTVQTNLGKYFGRHGMEEVAGRAEAVVRRLKIVVENDFKAPLAQGIKNKIRAQGLDVRDLARAEIDAGDKILHKAITPEPKAPPKPKLKALATDFVDTIWRDKQFKNVRTLKGGHQRTVTLVEDSNGVKYVEKRNLTGAGHPEELIYYNTADDLGMNIVPKTTQLSRGKFGDVLVQELVEAPTSMMAEVIAEQAGKVTHRKAGLRSISSFTEAEQKQLRKFVLETKQGRDWNTLDYIFGQVDRNSGNFAYNIKNGKIADFKLIDNNSAMLDFTKGKARATGGDIHTLLAVDPETKVKLQKWIKDLGYDGTTKSWDTVHTNLGKYFERNGMKEKALDRADNVAGHLRAIVKLDYKVPLADALEYRVNSEVLAPFTSAEIKAGDKLLNKIVSAKVKNPNAEFIEMFKTQPPPLTKLKQLKGGAQRHVSLQEQSNGRQFVVKEAPRRNLSRATADMDNELIFADFAHEMGMNIVPKIAKLNNTTLVQEFTNYKVKSSFKIAPQEMRNQVVEFMTTTKPGKDWGMMDMLFGASDRHGGNYALKMHKGKIIDIRLIDNNDLRFKALHNTGPMVEMDAVTKTKFKSWLGDMGWKEAAGKTDWDDVGTNIRSWLNERGIGKLPGQADLPTNFVSGVSSIVANDFKYRAAIGDYQIAGLKEEVKKVAKKVATAKRKNLNVEFAEMFKKQPPPLKAVKPLHGGAQRNVTLQERTNGEKFVVKKDLHNPYLFDKGAKNEVLFADFAHEMGMDIVPKVVRLDSKTLVQEFTPFKIKTSIKVPPEIMKTQIQDFIINTKPGKDWGMMDNLFGATDRHGGNFALKMNKGKIVDVRLIDNNDLAYQAVAPGGLLIEMDVVTKTKFKSWLGDMGWTEAGKTDWKEVGENIRRWLKPYNIAEVEGMKSPIITFTKGVETIVANDFKYTAPYLH